MLFFRLSNSVPGRHGSQDDMARRYSHHSQVLREEHELLVINWMWWCPHLDRISRYSTVLTFLSVQSVQRILDCAFITNELVHCTEVPMFHQDKDHKESAENCNTFLIYGMIVQTHELYRQGHRDDKRACSLFKGHLDLVFHKVAFWNQFGDWLFYWKA